MSIYLPGLYRGCRAHTLRPLFTWWATILPTYAFYVVICVIMCECLFVCACVYIYIWIYMNRERGRDAEILIPSTYWLILPSKVMLVSQWKDDQPHWKKHTSLSLSLTYSVEMGSRSRSQSYLNSFCPNNPIYVCVCQHEFFLSLHWNVIPCYSFNPHHFTLTFSCK